MEYQILIVTSVYELNKVASVSSVVAGFCHKQEAMMALKQINKNAPNTVATAMFDTVEIRRF